MKAMIPRIEKTPLLMDEGYDPKGREDSSLDG
jgi:hypothetical protein